MRKRTFILQVTGSLKPKVIGAKAGGTHGTTMARRMGETLVLSEKSLISKKSFDFSGELVREGFEMGIIYSRGADPFDLEPFQEKSVPKTP